MHHFSNRDFPTATFQDHEYGLPHLIVYAWHDPFHTIPSFEDDMRFAGSPQQFYVSLYDVSFLSLSLYINNSTPKREKQKEKEEKKDSSELFFIGHYLHNCMTEKLRIFL